MVLQAPLAAPPWLHDFARSVEQRIQEAQSIPLRLPVYTVSDLPDAAEWVFCMIYVSDETGGAIPAFSDGSDWRRCTDRAVVS